MQPRSQGPEVLRAALGMPELSPAERMHGGSRGQDTAVLRPGSQRGVPALSAGQSSDLVRTPNPQP